MSYAVTELLDGETLRARLVRSAVAWRKTVEIGTAVAEGLPAEGGSKYLLMQPKVSNGRRSARGFLTCR